MAQNLDKNKFNESTDIQLAELLEYLKGSSGGNSGDKTFETITVSNTVVKEVATVTATVNCPDGTEVTGGGFDTHGGGPAFMFIQINQ